MENSEEVFQCLDDFVKRKPKTIPRELEEYLAYVARTGDPVYQWSLVKYLFKEKLLNVITDFYETSPGLDIPHYPNVDPFNYDTMKNSLLERLDSFSSAPFTVQRICELLTAPRKQYNRIDKFMRAIEKNVLVVSTREPGIQRHSEPENGEQMESMVNGSDNTSDYNVDVEMEDVSWKENTEHSISQPQPGSSDGHISVDDIEARLQAKESTTNIQDKITKQYESVTPPEPNTSTEESLFEKAVENTVPTSEQPSGSSNNIKSENTDTPECKDESKSKEYEDKNSTSLNIPEIRVEDAEMTEKSLEAKKRCEDEQLQDSSQLTDTAHNSNFNESEGAIKEPVSTPPETNSKHEAKEMETKDTEKDIELNEPKIFSEVSTSSEESSSSSDNTDGNSNSPKPNNIRHIDMQEESNQAENNESDLTDKDSPSNCHNSNKSVEMSDEDSSEKTPPKLMQTDDYSISDVKSELPQVSIQNEAKSQEICEDVEEKSEHVSKIEKEEISVSDSSAQESESKDS
ncbi:hypothetical protein EVAR_88173_1 [Eumeta japonica]|uniref:Serine/threonine-protein phosphatase 4 regulatory subunit 2 n=1 Tax=Eumeta variegata TaxID=151549 RepID=A0A4C1WE27_EUMVA|nr:hypothetical protein EVAR_88173_1 [Eumeta japonica]